MNTRADCALFSITNYEIDYFKDLYACSTVLADNSAGVRIKAKLPDLTPVADAQTGGWRQALPDDTLVGLWNDVAGAAGNHNIDEPVGDAGFTVKAKAQDNAWVFFTKDDTSALVWLVKAAIDRRPWRPRAMFLACLRTASVITWAGPHLGGGGPRAVR